MAHSEDTFKEPRSSHTEVDEDDDDGTESALQTHPSIDQPFGHEEDGATPVNGFAGDRKGGVSSGLRPLSQEETIELVRRTVEIGFQETQRSLAGNEVVSDVVKPKLTIDLGYSNLGRIPDAVVDIIKDEVERFFFCLRSNPRILWRTRS